MPAKPPSDASLKWKVLSIASFVVFVAIFVFVSNRLGMRLLGISLIAYAYALLMQGRVAHGPEGNDPSGHASGPSLLVLAVAIAGFGAAMLVQPDLMLHLMGWADE